MNGVENLHVVNYDKYCPQCKSKDVKEEEEPCNSCLCEGATFNGVPNGFKKAAE